VYHVEENLLGMLVTSLRFLRRYVFPAAMFYDPGITQGVATKLQLLFCLWTAAVVALMCTSLHSDTRAQIAFS
jgi:hypothetical protein